ncbi:MAG: tetratricopeptide repeat protein [Spirochaetes bacterium]|nr:MAG: tetratricopeptide repeat protein [Spirochaetota bacterium]
MESREIEIRRNIVEKALMTVKDYVRHHRKQVAYGAAGTLIGAIFVMSMVVYYDHRASTELVQFEQALDKYRAGFPADDRERGAALDKAAQELAAIVDSSYWGYVHEFGYYIIGNLFFAESRYKESKDYFLRFTDKNPGSFFAPMGLQQAARSCEYLGDVKGAKQIYVVIEKEYGKSAISDQISYDLGRLSEQEGDHFKAREYFNKVVSEFPRSPFAQKAKERIMLLGVAEKKDTRP